jgi:hypothetical protein
MSKAVALGWIAVAVVIGLGVSGAGAQESAGNSNNSAPETSTPLAAPPSAQRPDVFVPPVRRVRPKTPPGPAAVRRGTRAANSKGSAGVQRAAGSKAAAGAGCEQAATLNRKLKPCEPKNGAKAVRVQNGAALPKGSAASQTP